MPIGFLDADCFYVSAERVRHLDLVGKPVGVLGNNGACVIAKSYEMKAKGVRTGETIWDASVKCPEGIYIKRDFRWYEVLSRQMLGIVQSFSTCVEYYSIDEFFFRYEGTTKEAEVVARTIRDRIWNEARLPVTVGIGRTRTQAKLFGETVKPFGSIAVLSRDQEQEILARSPVQAIAGIASRRAARLLPYGIKTCLELSLMPRKLVRSLLTITGEQFWEELNGRQAIPLQAEKNPTKMISRGGGFTATADGWILRAWLTRHVERLIEELDFHCVRTGKLIVHVEHQGDFWGVAEATLDTETNRFDLLLDAALAAFAEAWLPDRPSCRIQLLATALRSSKVIQRSLFETDIEKAEAMAKVKQDVNGRFGRFTLRSGATLPLHEIYQDHSAGFDICDIKGKVCF